MATQIAVRLDDRELAALDAEVAEGRATSTIRGLTSDVPVGPRNGLDHDSVVSCDTITTVRTRAVGDTIGLLFDDQEPVLARAISDAFELDVR